MAMENFAEIIATLSYLPAGLVFGLIIYLPQYNFMTEDVFKFWPFVVTLISLIVSASFINGLKLYYRRYKFVHFYIILVAELCMLTAGLILIYYAAKEIEKAIYISALGLGLIWIPGLSYITIRSKRKYRSFFASICSFNYLFGLALMMSIFDLSTDKIHIFGILLTVTSGLIIVLIGINERLQQKHLNGYNYARPLDYDVATSHENERLVLHNVKAKLFKIGNSSREDSKENYHSLWYFYNILTELQGFVTFYWIIVIYGSLRVMHLFQDESSGFAIFWFIVLGSFARTMLTLFVNNRIIYVTSSVLQILSLILCIIFMIYPVNLLGRPELGISHLLFFTFAGLSYGIPSINILEVSSINFNESFLAVGIIFEILSISMLQYFEDQFITTDQRVGYYIGAMVLCAILCTIVVLHMPNFKGFSLIEINNEMRKLNSYTVFTRDNTTASELSNQVLIDFSREIGQTKEMQASSFKENQQPSPSIPYNLTSLNEKRKAKRKFLYKSIRSKARAHLSFVSQMKKSI